VNAQNDRSKQLGSAYRPRLLGPSRIALILLFMPRSALAYPLYVAAASLGAISFHTFSRYVVTSIFLAISLSMSLAFTALWETVSVVAFCIELALFIPFVFIIVTPREGWQRDTQLVLLMVRAAALLSVANLTINYGFPLRLPYIHYLPDAIAAFWGNGGVKIVTTIGFMGILCFLSCDRHERNVELLILSTLAFLLPSYNIGIAAGLIGFTLFAMKNVKLLYIVAATLIAAICLKFVAPYVAERVQGINTLFSAVYGIHPKWYAYKTVLDMWQENPQFIPLGSGLGTFSGTATLWSSDYLAQISSHTRPDVPGLFESSIHSRYLGPALYMVNVDPWALSSSLNKPYSSTSTLLAEAGLAGFVLLTAFISRVSRLPEKPEVKVAVLAFLTILFTIDHLHTNPLFLTAIALGMRGVTPVRRGTNSHQQLPSIYSRRTNLAGTPA
jgi:hypothetical protein